MNIAVCIKQTADTETIPRLDAKGGQVLTDDTTWIINPHDESAIEVALQLTEQNNGSVTVIALGPMRVEAALRNGLAMGADRAIHLSCEDMPHDAHVTARALAPILASEGFDLVLTGQTSVDSGGGQVPQRLGVLLGWPSVSSVERLELNEAHLTAARPMEEGQEVHTFKLPAIVGINRRIGEPRYPSFRNIMKAKRKPIERIKTALAQSQLICDRLSIPEEKAAGEIIEFGAGVAERLATIVSRETKIV